MVFNIIYTIEAIIKLIAFGRDFFKDGWNSFDFVIVVAAWVGTIANNIDGLELGQSTTIIKSFRICRIFKIIKKNKSLRILFFTFIGAIQQLTNVGGLLFLFLFVYSVLGVQVFAGVKMQNSINVHANFQNFHNAIITLFRMATGESWHELMYDCARQKSIVFDCMKSQDYQSFKENGYQRLECGNRYVSYFYFISFMVIVSFIFLNLFIAIILESFNTSQNEEGLKIGQQSLNLFSSIWAKFDSKGKGFIKHDELDNIIDELIQHESELLLDARIAMMNGEIRKSEFDNQTYLFNLHKNQYLSGNVLLRQANIAKKRKEEEEKNNSNGEKQAPVQSQKEIDDELKEKADQKETLLKLMNYYVMQLKIPVYGAENFYYYDVLEALTRDVFFNSIKQERQDVVDMLTIRGIWSTEKILERDREVLTKIKKQTCKYCFETDTVCPLIDNLYDEHITRYVDGEESDEELEQEHDFLVGQLDPILGKLEKKGQAKDVTIQKYQEMSDLRAKRNTKSLENKGLSEYGDAIIDSSQIKAAAIIRKYYHNWKARKIRQKFIRASTSIKASTKAAKKLSSRFKGKVFGKKGKSQAQLPTLKKGLSLGGIASLAKDDQQTSASPCSQPVVVPIKADINDSVDSTSSLSQSQSNKAEQPPTASLLSPVTSASPDIPAVIAPSQLHQINELPPLEEAGDMTVIQNSQHMIIENNRNHNDTQNEMNVTSSFCRDSGPGNKQGEEVFPITQQQSRQVVIRNIPSEESLVRIRRDD